MYRLIILTGLAVAVLLAGCAPARRDEPVSQDKSVRALKSIGRLLRESAQKLRGVEGIPFYKKKITRSLDYLRGGQLGENQFSALVDSIEHGGEEAIRHFKLHPISSLFGRFTDNSEGMIKILQNKINGLSLSQKEELDRLSMIDQSAAARFLKRHTDIADDKKFAELVRLQGLNLNRLNDAVIANHRLADAVAAELDVRGVLRRVDISKEALSSDLKLNSTNFALRETVFSTKNEADSYKFLQELSGVDVYKKGKVLHTLLTLGPDGKHLYRHLSPAEIKEIGPPLGEVLTRGVINPHPAVMRKPHLLPQHLREFYKTDQSKDIIF